jgi:hypothetical protein
MLSEKRAQNDECCMISSFDILKKEIGRRWDGKGIHYKDHR